MTTPMGIALIVLLGLVALLLVCCAWLVTQRAKDRYELKFCKGALAREMQTNFELRKVRANFHREQRQ